MVSSVFFVFFIFFGQFSNAVINGIELPRSIYPQIVESENDCTVSYIGPRAILTSAHCVTSNHFEVDGQSVEMFIHPDFWMDVTVGSFDIAVGVLKRKRHHSTPLSICSPSQTRKWMGQSVAQVGYGCNHRVGSGRGVKRYNFTKIARVEQDYMRLDAGLNGAVGCYGDSGGPYLLRNKKQKTSCILAVHFDSNLRRINMATNVFDLNVKNWLNTIAHKKNIFICGINMECSRVFYPLQ